MQQKRVRSANFTPEETLLCLNLIENYKSIVECKKTDAKTCREKEHVWKQIEYKFNLLSTVGVKRTKESLKKFYENKKKRRKTLTDTNSTKADGNPLDRIKEGPTFDVNISDLDETVVANLKSEMDNDEECLTLEEELVLSSDTEDSIKYATNLDNGNNVSNEFNSRINSPWEEIDPHFLPLQSSTESYITGGIPRKRKIRIENNWVSRRRPTTAILARKYENLAGLKKDCSNIQLVILKTERKSAALKLKITEEENEQKKEERKRKEEEYERNKTDYERQKEREEELFNLRRQSLLLDIELKKCQLQKLKSEES